MPFDSNFEKRSQNFSVQFLKALEKQVLPEQADIYKALVYLGSLSEQVKAEELENMYFQQELFDLAANFQKLVLNPGLNENPVWSAEKYAEAITALFESMPAKFKALHNKTLASLSEALEADEPLKKPKTAEPDFKKSKAAQIRRVFENKSIPYPKRLAQVLAACAALSIPGDRLQLEPGLKVWLPEADAFSRTVSASVENTILPRLPETSSLPSFTTLPSLLPPESQAEIPFTVPNTINYPPEIVAEEVDGMASRLQYTLSIPERRDLFETLWGDNRFRSTVALLGIIESNLDATAVSPSGARGPFQDMGGLQGAFGNPDLIETLAQNSLMPTLENPEYNRIITNLQSGVRMDRGTLLEFLITQRDQNTNFWQRFLSAQITLITNPVTAAEIAGYYLTSLETKAATNLNLTHPNEANHFAILSYNLGISHLHTLRRIMNQHQVTDFSTHSVLSFIERDDFRQILRDNNLGDLYNNYHEAQRYLARFIALENLLNSGFSVTTSNSTTG